MEKELPPDYWRNQARPGAAPARGVPASAPVPQDVALASAIQSLSQATQPSMPSTPKAAVLGGGISGLASAYELAKQGVEVTVIEGSGRLGGHIYTKRDTTESGLYFERGAELVDSEHHALQKLMGELGVGLVDSSQSTEGDFFHANGQVHSEDQIFEAYKPLAVELKSLQNQLRTPDGQWTQFAHELDKVSMETMLDHYVRQGVVESWVPTMFKQAYSGEIGRDPSEISAVAFLDSIGADIDRGFELYGDSDEAYRVQNGTESIINALEAKLKEMGVTVKTHEQVTELENMPSGEGMVVHSIKDGVIEKTPYDYVVSALPLPALRDVKGVEKLGLSEEQLSTIRDTNYCTLTKFAIETKGKPWLDIRAADGTGGNGTIYTDGTFQTAWVSSEGQPGDNLQDPDANGMVTFFVGGSNGQMPTPELIAKAKQEYAAIIGKPESEVFTDTAPAVANWSTESRGCYVAPAPGQYMNLHTFREQANPNFSMVGEFIPVPTERGHCIGFMNNGADSAQREAARAVEILQQRQMAQMQQVGHAPLHGAAAERLPQAPMEQLRDMQNLGHHTAREQQRAAGESPPSLRSPG